MTVEKEFILDQRADRKNGYWGSWYSQNS